MHLPRSPSKNHGVVSFIWAIVIALLIWAFLMAIGFTKADSFIIAAVAACGVFLYVRVYGEDEPRRKTPR
jgi:hypothetical protein